MLSDRQIKAAAPGDKPRKLYDERGLYLEVRRTVDGGAARWWRFRYRFDGREKLLSLGTYPDVSLAEARKRRDEARTQVAAKVDPSQVKQAEKAARKADRLNTFEAVARAWLEHRGDGWTAKTETVIEASLQNHVFPTLGARPLVDITARDIMATVRAVEAAGARETAGRVFQRIASVFRYAVVNELLQADPCASLKPGEFLRGYRPTHRAAISEADAPEFLRKLADYGDARTRDAMRLLILTAVRPGELRGARWDEFEGALWRIPGERMKMKTPHLVPLSRQAVALVEAQPRKGDALVFPSPYYPGKPLSENTLNSALARMGYKGAATAHGFRTLFSTAANEAGWKGDVIERQLAHEPRDDVRAAYNRAQHLGERAKLMQWWADRIDELERDTN